MPDPRTTEERLRTWLDGNQPQRERLCLHLLSLLGDYSRVEPRRPKGGPDGARDIQAVYRNSVETWGAVGFRNSPSDSSDDKRWVTNKFKSDLDSALNLNSEIQGFVFFTNVDLTPTESKGLREFATGKGIQHVEIFYRERLRQALDSPSGFGYRLQYLDLEMTHEEQVSFIERFETIRQELLTDMYELQRQNTEQLARIHFLNECMRPVTSMTFMVDLKHKCTPQQIGHFRVFIRLERIFDPSPWDSLYAAFRDMYMTAVPSDETLQVFGIKGIVGSTLSKDMFVDRAETTSERSVNSMRFSTSLRDNTTFEKLGDFDGAGFDVFVTEPLLARIRRVALFVNNYGVVDIHEGLIVAAEEVGLVENSPPDWPEPLKDSELAVHGKRIYIRSQGTDDTSLPPPKRHAARQLNFNSKIPERVDIPSPNHAGFLTKARWIMK